MIKNYWTSGYIRFQHRAGGDISGQFVWQNKVAFFAAVLPCQFGL